MVTSLPTAARRSPYASLSFLKGQWPALMITVWGSPLIISSVAK